MLACAHSARGTESPSAASSGGFTPYELARLGMSRPAGVLAVRDAVPASGEDEARLALLRAGFRLDGGTDAEPAYADWLAHEPLAPGRSRAQLGLGLAALSNHLPKPAWEDFRRVRAWSRPSPVDDAAAFWEGEAAWQLGEDAAAGRAFGEVLTTYRGSPYEGSAAYRMAWVESRQGSSDAALAHFELAERLDRTLSASASLQRGWVLLQAGRTPEARAVFDAAAAGPDRRSAEEALVGQAECAYRTDDFAGADKLFDAALARAPDARAKAPLTYSLGWAALKQRQFPRARATFLGVVKDYPQEPAAPFAAYRAALCLFDLGKPDDALLELKDVAARWPGHEVGEWATYSRGWIHLSLGRFNEAKAAFRALLDQYPSGKLVAPARYLLASTLLQERHFREAEREFVSLAADLPSSGLADGALLWAGWAALLDGRAAEALPHLDLLAARYPKSPLAPDAALAEGEAAFALHEYARAGRAYGIAAAATGETRIKGLIGQGWCGFAAGDWKTAETAFRAALGEATDARIKNRARVRLGDALFNQKRFGDARGAYTQVVAGPEEDLARWAQLQLGWCAFRSDDPDEARRTWDQLRRRWPGTAEAVLALQASAETLFQREQYAAAETAFRRLATEAAAGASPVPELAETAALRIGDCLYNAKSYGPAVLAYREYTARYPESPRLIEALYGMQWAYLQMGDYDAARNQAREFLTRFPQASLAAEVQLMVAESFRREKKPLDALEQYRGLIEKYPDSDLAVSARLKSGEALEDLGRFPEAEVAYATFLAKYPKHALAKEASFRLGLVRYAAGNFAGAVELFGRVADDVTDPRAPEALYNLCLVRKKQGDQAGMESAVKRLDRSFPRARAAAQAHLVLAYFLGDRGAKAEALPHFEAVQACGFLDLSAEASYALGDAASSSGDKTKALEEWTKGANGLPKGGEWSVQCAFAAADALAAGGRHDEAVDMFRRVLEKEDATPEWMATAYFGIGQRYEALAKPGQAKQMYLECVKRNPPPDLLRAATDRLKALGTAAAPGVSGEEDETTPSATPAKPKAKPQVKPKGQKPSRTGKPASGAPAKRKAAAHD
ncbi:MAG: tetratricopeptide repeat protein [Candidatus Coatesbacteria bacterium]